MQFERAHLWNTNTGISATATVDVPGLGKVEFKTPLSDETVERVRTEVIAALRLKMGQKLTD